MGFEINLITLRKKFCLFCRINNFNQYTAIDTFVPQYDADGNQTLIKTSTGIWSVTYNVENRPVRWECGDTVVTMDFDRMGRRTFYKEMNGNTQVTFTRFVYKDYLCVRQVFSNSPYNTYKNFVWDPTETIATRPLKLQLPTMSLNLFYMHDGNKNVSDVVYRLTSNGVAAHYDYAPFGAVTRSVSNAVPTADITTLNPFRFSSEYHDDTLGLVYYNYRHYNPTDGRWISRDFLGESSATSLYAMLKNQVIMQVDFLGNVSVFLVIEWPIIHLPQDLLLEKRYGLNWKGRKNPIAFTRANVDITFSCYCDDALGVVGSINAILEIQTYMYDSNDPVRIKSNSSPSSKEDVYRQEHARDYRKIFAEFSSINVRDSYFSDISECNQKMQSKVLNFKNDIRNKLLEYSRQGHQDPKFEVGGDFFVEGDYL